MKGGRVFFRLMDGPEPVWSDGLVLTITQVMALKVPQVSTSGEIWDAQCLVGARSSGGGAGERQIASMAIVVHDCCSSKVCGPDARERD